MPIIFICVTLIDENMDFYLQNAMTEYQKQMQQIARLQQMQQQQSLLRSQLAQQSTMNRPQNPNMPQFERMMQSKDVFLFLLF